MKQKIKLFHQTTSRLDSLLEWNPQLFREVKGRLKARNIIIAAAISAIGQFIISLGFLGQLPEPVEAVRGSQYSRYCFGEAFNSRSDLCQTDLLNNWVINWQLFWLDLFLALSVVGIFILLVVGTYMLIADTVQEENRGTLNFIRLTPQSADNILLGKILGVPILMYLVILLGLPLHLIAGLGAKIPLTLILGFDVVVIASCACFYSAALLWSLVDFGLSGFKSWLASGAVFFLLFPLNIHVFANHSSIHNHTFEGFMLFNPGIVFPYLVDATHIASGHVTDLLSAEDLGELLFYGRGFWTNATVGISVIIANFALWTYWFWSALKRRFHNPQNTLLSKTQSYWLTGCFIAVALGFTLQSQQGYRLEANFMMLQLLTIGFFLILIAALSPHRQSLQDWARYRHQLQKDGNILWKELIFGENSPSTVAIALNLLLVIFYITPSLFIFSLGSDIPNIFWGMLLAANMTLFYAAIAQLILISKTRKRAIAATVSTASLMVIPLLCLGFTGVEPRYSPELFMFTFLPTLGTEYASLSTILMSILGQWLMISVVGFQITSKLRQAGASETKMLLSNDSIENL